MGLRAKLATAFLVLLIVVVVAISAVQIDRTMNLMVDDLANSGDILIDQSFEQIRATLSQTHDDPALALSRSPGLRALLESSTAFGKGVIYARIEGPGGQVLVAAPANTTPVTTTPVQPFSTLENNASSWQGLARIYMLWGESAYELSRPVELNGRPWGEISIGVSTALMSTELHRSVKETVLFAVSAVLLGLLGATILGRVLLKPVAAIATGVEQLAVGRDPRTVTVGGSDELSSLADKFNQLSQRINSDRSRWEHERGQFFNIFRSITDAVLLLDASGAILFANGEAAGRLGLPAGGLTDGKPLRLLLGATHPLVRMIDTAYATGTEVHDVALQLGDGKNPLRLLVSISSLGHGPEPAGLLVIVRDLEPVRELESVVDHSGRLARLAALVSGIAHQIRNPLNSMTLQLELLTQDSARGRPIEPRLQTVRKEIRRLDEAVDALMRFMKPESLRLAEIGLNDLLTEIANQVSRPDVKIETSFDPRVSCITGDRALLAEAFVNIASNGVEAMPNGGILTLRTGYVGEDSVEVTISDQGNGIPPEQLDQIFQLYFTTKPGGTGLGLSLAARAIDLHRGTVDVRSEVGAGTTVRVRLPIVERALGASAVG